MPRTCNYHDCTAAVSLQGDREAEADAAVIEEYECAAGHYFEVRV